MEPWEIEVELETDRQAESLIKKETLSRQNLCPECNSEILGNVCPKCGHEIAHKREFYEDPTFEEYMEKVEKANKEFEENLRWEEVPDKE